ncbi:hypothetical protein Tco_0822316 [Tanacetum coccineum]|uniref:Uncharacterized protein n=1 Tax=Tanacetum coccineum TaxID=301880 RepID=A0ABQ5AHQ7_9ASTR
MLNGTTERATDEHHFLKVDSLSVDQGDTDCVIPVRPEIETDSPKKECSCRGSPSEDRSFRSDVDSADTEEAPFSGQEGNEQNDILDWAKVFSST